METNLNNMGTGFDAKDYNNFILQGVQMKNQNWIQMPNQGENQVHGVLNSDFMNMQGSNTESNSNKSPWSLSEEHVFWEKHDILGNKWVEIAKSLPGRNDNAVKNYFYSSIRKYIRKIAKSRISPEQK